MKKKNTKKFISAFAVLAVSATMAMTAIPFAGCDKASNTPKPVSQAQAGAKATAISTAFGTTYSAETGNKIWVSTTAEFGKEDITGTISDPYNFFWLMNTDAGLGKVNPGDTILFKPGVHIAGEGDRVLSSLSGSYDKYITIRTATHDDDSSIPVDAGKATIDFSNHVFNGNNRGVQINGDYIYWYGIDICGAGDNGMYIGGNFNTVEFCEFYNNRDTGLQLGRADGGFNYIEEWPSYNLIKNCTSHNNYDNETFGENADGFAAKLTIGYGNVFDGCIAYRNSDDGWDLYAKADSGNIGTVIIYNCVAYENGFLEYTRDECNSLYPDFVAKYEAEEQAVRDAEAEAEANGTVSTRQNVYYDPTENPYLTRDGDGNGFKLGGSIMEGDVVMYNCLSFQNRMHGVTDNSNPGYLKILNVTSYDNSATVDNDGNIVAELNSDTHANVDVSRQTYSYNTVNNTLSVMSNVAQSLETDAFRGTSSNSLLNYASRKTINDEIDPDLELNVLNVAGTYVVAGSIEADSKNGSAGTRVEPLQAAEMFKTIPVVLSDDTYTYNVQGARDSMIIEEGQVTSLLDGRAHIIYRNADGSINMGDILAKTDKAEEIIQRYLGSTLKEGEYVGSELNYTSWDKYIHPYEEDFVVGESEAKALIERVKEALLLSADEVSVYQDFEVPIAMWDAQISWESSDPEHVIVTDVIRDSVSNTQFLTMEVWRPYQGNVPVTITATISYGGETATKTFDLTIMEGNPSLGTPSVLTQNGEIIYDGGSVIIDQFQKYVEPQVQVLNGLYPDAEKYLPEDIYTYTSKYEYASDKNSPFTQVNAFTPSKAGVFVITHTITLGGEGSYAGTTTSMSYTVYNASLAANVDLNDRSVTVFRDGYTVKGDLTSATGYIYAVSSTEALTDLTKDNIATYSGVTVKEFRSNTLNLNFNNANSASYYIYYALGNLNGDITSVGDNDSGIYCVQITALDITTTDQFVTLATTGKLGSEEPTRTVYLLRNDLDFTDITYTVGNKSFTGVFNGNGHTISNLSTSSSGIFYKVTGGTIMNLKVENLNITGSTQTKIGFVTESTGGYFYNLAFHNVNVGNGTAARIAALIGQVGGSSNGSTAVYPLSISQVSIVNDNDNYMINGTQRVGGLVGFVQYYGEAMTIDNCYVNIKMSATGTGESAGMVATWEDMAGDSLTITNCYYTGTIVVPASSTRASGMLGYHKGGAGTLYIANCVSLPSVYLLTQPLVASIKNSSPILGNYSTNGIVKVENCISDREEYNSDYAVAVYTTAELALTGVFEDLKFDMTRWQFVYAEGTTNLEAPYLTLLFLD